MSTRVGGPRDPESGRLILRLYDDFVATTWPVPCEEMDVSTSYGSTHVRRSGPASLCCSTKLTMR